MYTKTILVFCCLAAFFIQYNNAEINGQISARGPFFNSITNTIKTKFQNQFKSLLSNVNGQIRNGISSLKNLLPMVSNIQSQMLSSAKSMANSTFTEIFNMLYNGGAMTLFKNLTTAVLANGQNYSSYLIVSGKNFSNCLNVSQIMSLRQSVIQNVTNCVQTQANNTRDLIQNQISSLFNLSANGLDVSASILKCAQNPLNITRCLRNVISKITTYVRNLPQSITNMVQSDLNTITKMGFNMTLCGTNMSLQVVKSVATVGMNHMGCVYKLVSGQFDNATSTTSTSTSTTASTTTSTAGTTSTTKAASGGGATWGPVA